MTDETYSLPETPVYHEAVRKIQNGDPIDAEEILNPLIQAMLENTEFVRQLAEAIADAKQDKLTGAEGQVVGFDADGNPVPQGTESLVGPPGATGADGTRGSQIHYGTAVTGTSTTGTVFSGSGIPSALVNDLYINTSTWNTYRCTTEGTASSAKWAYIGRIKGATGATGPQGPAGSGGGGVGKSMAGLSVQPTSTTTVTAGEGAEIFNDLRERTYDGNNITTGNVASGIYSHAEGERCTASGNHAHAEGRHCTASGEYSHAEGTECTASGNYAHVEGATCTAGTFAAHAEGYCTLSTGRHSHVGGYYCIVRADYQTAIGKYNVESAVEADKLIIGKGTSTARANCFRVTHTGVFATGNYSSTGADYAELFEWLDGNPNAEDRAGRFVTLDGEKIRLAGPDDSFILGIISGNPSVIGDVHDDQWQGMYLYDIFGRPLWEDVEIPAETVEEPDPEDPEKTVTRVLIPAHMEHRQKLNPDYDGSQPYTPRTERPEWGCVGMLGKLVVLDNGECQVNGWCKPGADGTAVPSDTPTKFRMMSRLDETHIRILIL